MGERKSIKYWIFPMKARICHLLGGLLPVCYFDVLLVASIFYRNRTPRYSFGESSDTFRAVLRFCAIDSYLFSTLLF